MPKKTKSKRFRPAKRRNKTSKPSTPALSCQDIPRPESGVRHRDDASSGSFSDSERNEESQPLFQLGKHEDHSYSLSHLSISTLVTETIPVLGIPRPESGVSHRDDVSSGSFSNSERNEESQPLFQLGKHEDHSYSLRHLCITTLETETFPVQDSPEQRIWNEEVLQSGSSDQTLSPTPEQLLESLHIEQVQDEQEVVSNNADEQFDIDQEVPGTSNDFNQDISSHESDDNGPRSKIYSDSENDSIEGSQELQSESGSNSESACSEDGRLLQLVRTGDSDESPDTQDLSDIIEETSGELGRRLPPSWSLRLENGGIHLVLFNAGEVKVVQRSLFVDNQGYVSVYVHGCKLPQSHDLFKNVDGKSPFSSVLEFSNLILGILSKFRLYETCTGVDTEKYKHLWKKIPKAVIDHNQFHETRYRKTCRSEMCLRIVPQTQRRCEECRMFNKHFKYAKPVTTTEGGKQKTPNKFTRYKVLNSAEKEARQKRSSKNITSLKRQVARLKEKVNRLIEKEGVEIDDELNAELTATFSKHTQKRGIPLFQRIFIEEQLKAAKVKGKTGMRWHPLMIRFALQIKMLSSTAYEALRSSGFIALPSERTLFDYSHVMDVKEGCHQQIIEDIARRVNELEHDYQKYHALSFDEIYINQRLVYRKSTGEVIGYCKLDEVQYEIFQLETHLEDSAADVSSTSHQGPPIAKRILSYLVKGVASNVQCVVASYPVSSLMKEDLDSHTWEVTEMLELHGIRVCSWIGDGSAVNRGFLDSQPPAHPILPSGVVYCTVNRYAPHRLIFFISDVAHLLKSIRNCFARSNMKRAQKLFKNGEYTITRLYKMKSEQTIKKLHKLTAPCVFLNSYSIMNVAFAARVMSGSVANYLEQLNWPNTKETWVFGNGK